MQSFTQHILSEAAAAGKNLHLEHIEDEILNFGVPGGRAAINFIQSLRDMFAGESKGKVDISVKWDGAPAIFVGIDPEDGKFFVGTKGVFNKNPKLVKSLADVKNFSGGLQDKLALAFTHFSKLGIKNVIQGDKSKGSSFQNSALSIHVGLSKIGRIFRKIEAIESGNTSENGNG